MKKRTLLCSMTILLFFAGLIAQLSSPLGSLSPRTGLLIKDETTIKLIHNSSGDLAHDYVSQLAQWDRSQVTEGFGRAAEWVSQKAKEFGLEQVTIEKFPSDGKVEYFGNPTERLWKVKKAELWMTAPFQARLTTYAEVPMSLARNSTTADVETELVDVGSGVTDADYRQDVKGKIVLASANANPVFRKAVMEKGAAGVVSYWSVPEWDLLNRQPGDFPDEIGWSRIPDQPGHSGDFAFGVSARRGQELRTMLRQGKTIKVHAIVDAELVPGSLDVVSGMIRGSRYPDEEIVVTAHLDHYKPGANDNASGSSSALEIARTLKYLVDTKQIPPPLRTIRFLWVPEYNGTWAWLSKHQNDPVRRIANFNFDMLGENLMKTNAVFAISYTPDSNPSFLNAVMESILDFMNRYNDERYPPQKDFHVISVKGSQNRLQGRMVPFTVGTDHELFNNLKIPGTGPLGWPDDYYHSSEDSPDKVDPTQLHRVVVVGLTGITTVAYADNENAIDLANLVALYAKKRVVTSEFAAVQGLLSSNRENFAEKELWSKFLIRHVYARERDAIRSAAGFSRNSVTKTSIEQIASSLDDDEQTSLRSVGKVAENRGKELEVAMKTTPQTEAERKASRLIPVREKGKELYNAGFVFRKVMQDTTTNFKSLSANINRLVQELQAQGEGDLRLMGLSDAPAYYADGKRSLLEIRNAFAVEYGSLSVETIELYFRAYEKAGLMKILQK